MQNFNRIIDYIKHESEQECKKIALEVTRKVEQIRTDFSKKEHDAYTSYVTQGQAEIEERITKLAELAQHQAQKMIDDTAQDMLDEVLYLTAKKLDAMPPREYINLLKKLGIDEGCKPEYLVHQYRDELAPTVISALFS